MNEIHFLKYVCLCCDKCLDEIGMNWCSDCFTSAKVHRAIEDIISALEESDATK